MKIEGWKYYNHAAVPTYAPHEEVNKLPLSDGTIWNIDGGTPLLARWISDFDCGFETNWWYIIKDSPIDLGELSKHYRKQFRYGLKKCEVKIINSSDYVEELYECSQAAYKKFKNPTNEMTKKEFVERCLKESELIYWAAFSKESNKLIGYIIVREREECVELITARFYPEFLNMRVSDALYYTIINFYLEEKKKRYVSSGQRNINHITNTQDYKEKTLGYRKAYCKLNIKYRFPINIIVKLLFPFRMLINRMTSIKIFHLIFSVLKMEEIRRENEKHAIN